MTAQTQTTLSPFHEGEKMMQRRVGKSDEMEKVGRAVIRPFCAIRGIQLSYRQVRLVVM